MPSREDPVLTLPSGTVTATATAPRPSWSRPPSDFSWGPQPDQKKTKVRMIVAHAGGQTMERAVRLVRNLTVRLGPDFELQAHWWNFARRPQRAAIDWAAWAAVEAEMVICSLPPGEAIPLACKTWLESWRWRKNGRDSALVVLLETRGRSPDRTRSVQTHLQRVAQSASMDFFANEYTLGLDLPRPRGGSRSASRPGL